MMETNYLDETTVEESGFERPDQPKVKSILTVLIIIYLIQNVLSAEIFFKHKTYTNKSESYGHMYLAIEKWIFWTAYAVLPTIAIVLSLAAMGMSKTKEMKAFFLYIALITLLTTVFIMLYLRVGIL